MLTNRESHHPWIDRPELDGALIIPFSEPTVLSQTDGVEQLLRALLASYDIRGVVVHHNQWLYDRLPWITRAIRASRGRLHPHRRVPRWRVPAQQCGGRRRHHRAPCDLADARTVDARRAEGIPEERIVLARSAD
ncbi:MAG: hypothetical protein R2692_00915 [Microbacterium sp.]